VPSTGAYLGAWLQPAGAAHSGKKAAFADQMQSAPAVQQTLGRRLAILHVYTPWEAPAPIADLDSISANGSIPLLDWSCGMPDDQVAAGAADGLITAYAEALKAYAKPVFLRWYWEMNLLKTHARCQSAGGAADYVSAWQRIWTIFHQVGATNVAFVWSPGVSGVDPAPFYPGDQYVDWIGVDGYDRKNLGVPGFTSIFSAFYDQWQSHAKPMMVAETGARPSVQAAYLEGAASALPSLPAFKAVVYFDATGPAGSWVLTGAGLTTLGQLARSQLFAPSPTDP
jgi:hypothetical protein